MDILPIQVEVVNESNLNENELAEFVETEPMQVDEQTEVAYNDEELIKDFIDGKLSFSDYKCQVLDKKVDSDDEYDDEEVDDADYEIYMDEDEVEKSKASIALSSDKFQEELDQSRKQMLRGQVSRVNTSKVGRKKKSILPAALQGLMGEANLRYARGDNETAKKICLEIVRQVPLAVEPFHTLAQIYEGIDQEKCMQFMLIAGHLNPSDVDHWIRLAELSEEKGNLKQCTMCLTRAVKAAPKDIDLHLRRIDCIKRMGDEKYALKAHLVMIRHIEDPVYQLEVTKEVAKKYHDMGAPDRALKAFQAAHATNAEHFSVVDLNQYLELLIDSAHLYLDALNILCQHTKIDIQVEPRTETMDHLITSVTFPADLIPDFRTKAAICLIYLKCTHLFDHIINDVLSTMKIETDGDCLLDIAEAFMAEQSYEMALQLLQPLTESENFSLAAVFLRYADCLRLLGDVDRAIESYRHVVQLAPQHLDARLTLSALLKQKNQHAEALKALEQDLEADVLDPTLLYEHCYMLKETGNIEQYIDLCGILLSRHGFRLRRREEVEISIMNRRISNSWNSLKEYREFRLEECEDTEGPEFVKSIEEPDKEKEWELFMDVIKQCYYTKRFATMQTFIHTALTSKQFTKHRAEIQYYGLISSMANKDYDLAMFHAKELLFRNPGSIRAWNIFMAILQTEGQMRKHSRAIDRLIQKFSDVVDPRVRGWKTCYWLTVGTYQQVVRKYSGNFKNTKEPFAALLTAIALSHMAVAKFAHHKSDYINQAIVFLHEYEKTREPEAIQEIYYNLGRLYHQLSLLTPAAANYKKVLECETPTDPKVAQIVDLKKEAAFNLHLIYKEAGNLTLARKYLFDYIVI